MTARVEEVGPMAASQQRLSPTMALVQAQKPLSTLCQACAFSLAQTCKDCWPEKPHWSSSRARGPPLSVSCRLEWFQDPSSSDHLLKDTISLPTYQQRVHVPNILFLRSENLTFEDSGQELVWRRTLGPAGNSQSLPVSLPLNQPSASLTWVVSNPVDQKTATSDFGGVCSHGEGTSQREAAL
ncbi:MACF1 [Cervus elaphus hippelaphus]|uniref:MACF1 n=1 Tax=Cervus elaphus hippelaphus TaxID=46360 RepID=A0A212CEQ9_CEREH|nr:MACF1 [Cervus elaphus hippelaphus]